MTENRDRCPECGSDAYYRYGKTVNGKDRRLCLVCSRQYVVEISRQEERNRPKCPKCGKPMHVYRREADCTRYRCSNYPRCKHYAKVDNLQHCDELET
jgi:transposase-like protein